MFCENILFQDILNSLSDMYSLLHEEDLWSGLWQKHARYKETSIAIAYEQQGFFEQAQGTYEVIISVYWLKVFIILEAII